MWGPSVQLYSLRSQNNWGIGDFSDLKNLVVGIAERGGDFVGINPIHSLFPANPEEASPYSPSSRRWLNIFYIDVQAIPEFETCTQAQQMVFADDFQQRLQQVREHEWVQYGEVAALKMAVLPLLYQDFKQRHLDRDSVRAAEFRSFVDEGGEGLKAQATFDALHASLVAEDETVWGWQRFPEKCRRFDSADVKRFAKNNAEQVELYLYLQWVADQQIGAVQLAAEEKGMPVGLYRDLAVGVAASGAECWADDGNLVQDMSIGAPPDVLGPQGQNWGLPPLNPQALEATGYDAFIKLLRANMKHCGALRIDHVLGLLRLWWIPQGMSALQGAYIYYPVKDMLAILALESHRHQCSIIGEDLGTVPEEITGLLQDAGIYSYKVFFFETSKTDGGYLSPGHYPEQSMAAICTHDMPTLRGYWHCDDLNLGRELGLYPNSNQLQGLFDARLKSKQGVIDSVSWHGYKPEGVGHDALYVPMDSYLAEALQVHMAAGSSALLSVQLEDWLEMDKPVNVPGTSTEYPNWRRKLSANLDDMFARDEVNRVAHRLSEIRRSVSGQSFN
jgi:4-alpha-glucanotransferase